MISLANGALIARSLIIGEFLGLNAAHSQTIRWRKPLWAGTAKSKIFRIPVKPVISEEDGRELKRLNNNYRTYRESLRRYFMKVTKESMVQFDEEVLRQAEEEDFARCLHLNDEWNKKVAESREKREADAVEARAEDVLRRIVAKEKRDEEILMIIEKKVRKAKAEVCTFITEKNIDAAIEEALDNVVNYNAAVDSEGNRYEGKYVPVKKETKVRLHADQ